MSAQHSSPDDGFHEIQLNGKQLVFLFMAATVVSVVIFLCGVLVGRGVHAERSATVADAGTTATSPAPDTPPAGTPAPAAPAAGSDPTKAAPPDASSDDLSYFNRLEKPNAAPEHLEAAHDKPADRPSAAAAARPTLAAAPPAASAAPPAAAPAASGGDGGGFALQVAALRVRADAEAIAKRLSSKGYSAYVLAPASGSPSVYRVRVGQFKTRREAESVAAKLQKEEQFKPWITR